MTQKRKLSDEERRNVHQHSRVFGGILIRMGRAYVAAIKAPNREENAGAEDRFFDALEDLVTVVAESGALD